MAAMSGNVARGWCAVAAGVALAASALATAGAAEGEGRSLGTSGTARRTVAGGGARLWVARYRNGSALAMAVSGTRVFVTGFSRAARSGNDYATGAYSAVTGARLWAARYNGPASGDDGATSVAVSPGGSTVYITGGSERTRRSRSDYATVAYSAATGAQLWAARHHGPRNSDAASSVAVGPGGGTVYVTGTSQGANRDPDFATVAYRAATGALVWAARYNGPARGENVAAAMAVTRTRVYVTGFNQSAGRAGEDYATVAYSAATGRQLWAALYHGLFKYSGDEANSVAVSPGGGTVYVSGSSDGKNGNPDYTTVAYSAATGNRLWVARYNGPRKGYDIAYAMAVTGTTVYVTGSSAATGSGWDYATVAYNAVTGAQLWVARYNGPGNGFDYGLAVAVSPGGSTVYVTGRSPGGAQDSSNYATVAYSAATGAQLWVRRYRAPGNGPNLLSAIAVSQGGARVYVTGSSEPASGDPDYAIVAYRG